MAGTPQQWALAWADDAVGHTAVESQSDVVGHKAFEFHSDVVGHTASEFHNSVVGHTAFESRRNVVGHTAFESHSDVECHTTSESSVSELDDAILLRRPLCCLRQRWVDRAQVVVQPVLEAHELLLDTSVAFG